MLYAYLLIFSNGLILYCECYFRVHQTVTPQVGADGWRVRCGVGERPGGRISGGFLAADGSLGSLDLGVKVWINLILIVGESPIENPRNGWFILYIFY